ncbi:hypothetical protein BGZ80_000788 [Entomortierella chlamydospora]|uniref:Uncharacterized protein n=1 Tax=Entomortierella chlamydospora TaxID=101097 RepID=A0A9P6MRP8_9FUNG|nr:hypothetical protein BGZ80_000788 [Entomortierella chlamydospora]
MHSTVTLRREPRPERIDIGDGLIMRWSTPQDKDNLADCLADAFRWETSGRRIPECGIPNKHEYISAAIGRLMSGKHVVQSQYDIALVEDTTRPSQGKNPIVAAVCMHQMAGYYGPIDITYGTLGAVGSLPEYRNRGLIRRLLFGYEYAVPHKFGRTLKHIASSIPALAAADPWKNGDGVTPVGEPFRLREVTALDIPYLIEMSTPDRLHCNSQLGLYYGKDFWSYIVEALKPELIENHHDAHHHAGIIVDIKSGKDIGISLTSNITGRWTWEAFTLNEELFTFRDVAYSVLRQLKAFDRPYYECYNAKLNNNILPDESETSKRERGEFSPLTFTDLVVNLTKHHPVTKILESQGKLAPENPPFRLYTRIHSLPKWIRKIAPVLEERLKDSVLKDISARIQLDFYRKLEGMSGRGLEIVFDQGKFVNAEDWAPKTPIQIHQESLLQEKEDLSSIKKQETVFSAGFAPMTFTRLVTGTMDVSELLERDSENYVQDGETKLALEILFPKFDHFVDLFWW